MHWFFLTPNHAEHKSWTMFHINPFIEFTLIPVHDVCIYSKCAVFHIDLFDKIKDLKKVLL